METRTDGRGRWRGTTPVSLGGGVVRTTQQSPREFAHIHPAGDGSLHLALPAGVREEARGKGWGEPHPISGTLLLFGPRDEIELETVWQILLVSYRYALGDLGPDA